jgi:predicted GH43/DUF377 family glycosyl hydrolase
MTSAVRRLSDQPIVGPGSVPGYGPIFNAGVLHFAGRFHLFARAVQAGYERGTHGGPRFTNYVSDIIVFTSDDGLRYEFGYELVRGGAVSFEYPRVQWLTSSPRLKPGDSGFVRITRPHSKFPPQPVDEPPID